MRIAIRADASTSIGTGHVMRQIALAQYLLSENHEVVLFASITGPEWLRKYVESQPALLWVEVEEGDFSAEPLLAGGALDFLVVDAYTLGQEALQLLEKAIPTVAVIVDGPWQDVSGKLAIAPTLDKNPSWATEFQKRFEEFHCGPEFSMLRREIIESREKRQRRRPNPTLRIVVALGRSDIGSKTERVVEILTKIVPTAAIDAYAPGLELFAGGGDQQVAAICFHEPGPDFVKHLARADLAVVGAGTTVAELLFVGIPSIFMAVAVNQVENYRLLSSLALAPVVSIESSMWEQELSRHVADWRRQCVGQNLHSFSRSALVDSFGAKRLLSVLTERHRV